MHRLVRNAALQEPQRVERVLGPQCINGCRCRRQEQLMDCGKRTDFRVRVQLIILASPSSFGRAAIHHRRVRQVVAVAVIG